MDLAAQRRKLRRLRAALRHEQQSIAMALASALQHSADKTTRAQHNVPRGQMNAGTEYYELSDEDVVPARGSQPPCLGEPRGPQDRDQLRTVEQTADYAPMVPILDAPVAQMVEQLPNLTQFFDILRPDPEQVIEVPKILPHDVPSRRLSRDTQLAEQLVEVLTILSFSSLQRSGVDIPVPCGGGPSCGLQGFSSGQSSTASPSSKKRISKRIVEQIVDPVSSGRLHGSLPGQGSSSPHSPAGVEERAPKIKKTAKVASHSGSELLPESSPSTPAAQLEVSVEWVRLRQRHAGKTYFWNRRTESTVWQAPAGVEVVWYGERDEEGGIWYWHRDSPGRYM